MASSQRVLDLIDTPIAIPSGHRPLPLSQVRGSLSFRAVDFAYSGRSPLLHHFNLEVPAGSTIGIVGATGSGKSTIVKLLLRLYELQGGEILLDGIPIHQLQLADLRRAIGLVSQEVFLFHGTVAENITVWRSGGVDERIFSISSRKPMFSISSASSRMTVLMPPSCRVLRSM